MGVEGIPLNWWNIHVFKVIGAKLGGVLEIAKVTLDFSFLNYAKIRVKGFRNGFLPSVLEMPRGSDMVILGIFPLMERHSSPLVGTRRALGPAFRRGDAVRSFFDASIPLPQEISNGAYEEKVNGEDSSKIGGKVVKATKAAPNNEKSIYEKDASNKEGHMGLSPLSIIYSNLMDIYINNYNWVFSFCNKLHV